ncbi:hypothetical protein BOX15_Mlig009938g3, partial [Macrostomum lignano]
KVFSYASYFSVSNFGDRSSGKQFEIPESQRHDANIGRALSEVGIDPLYSVFFDLLPKRPRHSVSDKPSPCDWWLCFSAHLGKFCDFPNRWKSLIQQVLSKNPSLLMYVAQQVMVMLLDEKYGFDFDETYPSRPFWFFIYGLLLLDEHELAGLTPAADGAASCLSLAASTRSSGDIPAGVKRLHTLLHRRYLAGRKRRLSPDVSVDYRAVSKRRWSEFKPWYQERQRQLLQLTASHRSEGSGDSTSRRCVGASFLQTFLEIVLANEPLRLKLDKALCRLPLDEFSGCLNSCLSQTVHWKQLMCQDGFARLARLSWEPPHTAIGVFPTIPSLDAEPRQQQQRRPKQAELHCLRLLANDSRAVFCEFTSNADKDYNVMAFSSEWEALAMAWYLQRHRLLAVSFSQSMLEPDGALESRLLLPKLLQLYRPVLGIAPFIPGRGPDPEQQCEFNLQLTAFNCSDPEQPRLTLSDPSDGNKAHQVGWMADPTLAARASCGRLLQGLLSDVLPMDGFAVRPDTLPVLKPNEFQVLTDNHHENRQVVRISLTSNKFHLPSRLVLKRIPSFNNFAKTRRLMSLASQSCRLNCAHINPVLALTLEPEFGIISELRLASCATLLASRQRKVHFTVAHLVSMLRQCLSALLYLLRQTCSDSRHHNNIKLSNILIDYLDSNAINVRLCDLACPASTQESVANDLNKLHHCLYDELLCNDSHGGASACSECSLLLPVMRLVKAKAAPQGNEEACLLELVAETNALDKTEIREVFPHPVLPVGCRLTLPSESDGQCLGVSEIPQHLQFNPSDLLLTGEKLGSGCFGSVVRGSLQLNGRRVSVAVKTLRSDASNSQFVKEVLTQASLPKHENILELLKVSEGEQQLITPYMEMALDKYLASHRSQLCSPNGRALDFLRQIASGMRFLSDYGVFHCDLAARNVLMENLSPGPPRLKIGDFGLSGMFQKRADAEYLYYTLPKDNRKFPMYILPPTDLQTKIYPTTDSWSFGTLIWEMFSHIPVLEAFYVNPSRDNGPLHLVEYVKKKPQKYLLPLDSVPPRLQGLVQRCWEPDHIARISLQDIYSFLHNDVQAIFTEPNGIEKSSTRQID